MNVISLYLTSVTVAIFGTVFGSQFQTAGAEHQQVHFRHRRRLTQHRGGRSRVMSVLSILD